MDGVVVRYMDERVDAHLIVEGTLDPATLDRLTGDFVEKLSRLEGVPYVCRRI